MKAIGRFMQTMEALRERVGQQVPVGDLLEAVLHETGYLEALEAERTIEAQGRLENLDELVEVAREYDATTAPSRPRTARWRRSCSRCRSSPTRTRAATTRAS